MVRARSAREGFAVSLTDVDRELLQRLVAKKAGAWNDFVDRYLSLIYHAIHHTAHLRSARLTPEDVEDIAAEVLVQLITNEYKALKEFRGSASLSTYLTVIARRICVHEITRRQQVREAIRKGESKAVAVDEADDPAAAKAMEKLEDVEALLRRLKGKEQQIVRLFYMEGHTYEEISTELDIPVNSIGAVLSRARAKLRELSKSYPGGVPVYRPRKSKTKVKPVPARPKAGPNAKPPKPTAGGRPPQA
jgi:RNA polymerase sigma-70 factor (ECF subfamily)